MNAPDSKSQHVQQLRNHLDGGSRVSLVVAVRNQAEALRRLIAGIHNQSKKPDEVNFDDGGSRDGTVELLRRILPENATFRVIEARKALPGYARNIGVANANFEWIAFTDPSHRLEPDWLARLIEIAHSDPETGVVVGNFDPETDSLFKQCAAIAYLPNKRPDENGARRGPFITSSLVRSDVWRAVGGFPDLPVAEDLIFVAEIERKAFKVKSAPKAIAHREIRPTLWSTFRWFIVYTCVRVWAEGEPHWHYGAALLYLFSLPFVVLAIWKSAWWLLVPLAGQIVRAGKNIWLHREGKRLLWFLNPLRFGYVLIIRLTVDLATFAGWLTALVNRRGATRARNHMLTRHNAET
jgi:GT2 family glycosyltransferase